MASKVATLYGVRVWSTGTRIARWPRRDQDGDVDTLKDVDAS